MENAGQVKYIITADSTDFQRQILAAERRAQEFAGTLANAGNRAATNFAAAMNEGLSSGLSYLQNYVNQIKVELNALSYYAGNVLSSTVQSASAAATGSLTSMVTQGIGDTSVLENARIKMISLTHSVEDGNKAFADTAKFYKNNPFNRFETTTATNYMIQYGQSVEDILPNLQMLGKVSLSTGTSIDSLAFIYSRVLAQGKVGYGDLQYFVEKGLNIYGELEKVTGKSQAEIIEMASNGTLALEDFKAAFGNLGDATAYDMFNQTLARAVDKYKGRLSDLRGAIAGYEITEEEGLIVDPEGLYRSWSAFLFKFADLMAGSSEIGKQWRTGLKKIGDTIANVIDVITAKMEPALRAVGNFINYLGDHQEVLLATIGIAGVAFGNLATKIPILGDAIGALKGNLKGLVNVFSVMPGWLQVLVAILGSGAIKGLLEGEFSDAFKEIVESLVDIGKALAPVIKQIVEIMADVGLPIIKTVLEATAKVLRVIADVLNTIPTEVLTGLVVGIAGLGAVKSVISPMNGFITMFSNFKDAISSAGSLKGGIEIIKNSMFGTSSVVQTAGALTNQTSTVAGNALAKGDTIKSGLTKVIEIVGIIAGAAIALAILDRGVQSDFTTLLLKLANMGIAIVEIGALAAAAGAIDKSGLLTEGFVVLEEFAIALASFAIGLTILDRGVQSDFGTLALKLANMGIAVVEIGVLAGIVGGIFATGVGFLVLEAGFVGLVEIAGVLATLALALGEVDKNVPADMNKLTKKIKNIKTVVEEIASMSAGNFFNNLFNSSRLTPIVATVKEYTLIAKELVKIDTLEFGYDSIKLKIKTLAKVVKLLTLDAHEGEDFSFLRNIKQNAQAFYDLEISAIAKDIIQQYADMIENIEKIDTFKVSSGEGEAGVNITAVESKIKDIAEIVELLVGKSDKKENPFTSTDLRTVQSSSQYKSITEIIDIAQSVINKYTEIIPTVKQLAGMEVDSNVFKVISDVATVIVSLIGTNLSTYKEFDENGNVTSSTTTTLSGWQNKEKIVSYAESILKAFSGMIGAVNDIASKEIKKTDAITSIQTMRDICFQLGMINQTVSGTYGGAATKEKEQIVESSRSILNKFTEIAPTVKQLIEQTSNLDFGVAESRIVSLRDICFQLGKINQTVGGTNGGAATSEKEEIVEKSRSILNKFTEIAPVLQQMMDQTKDFKFGDINSRIQNIIHSVWEIGRINQDEKDNLSDKIDIIDESTEIAKKLITFAGEINKMPEIDKTAFSGFTTLIKTINEDIAGLISTLVTDEQEFTAIGTAFGSNMVKAWKDQKVDEEIQGTIKGLVDTLSSDVEKSNFSDIGEAYSTNIVFGFKNNTDSVYDAGYHVGYWLAEGFKNAIYDATTRINEAAKSLSDSAINTFNTVLKISSPSKIMYKIGSFVGEGLAEGIESQEEMVKNAVLKLTDDIKKPIEGINNISLNLSGQSGEINGGISNKSNTINMTNNIYSQFDMNQIGRDMMWKAMRI